MKNIPAINSDIHLAAAFAIAVTILAGSSALAAPPTGQLQSQTPPSAVATPQGRSVNLTEEDRHTIKEIVLNDLKIPSIKGDAPSKVGAEVPSSVALQPMPAGVAAKVPSIQSHLLFVKDNRVIIVSPKDNKIADVVE